MILFFEFGTDIKTNITTLFYPTKHFIYYVFPLNTCECHILFYTTNWHIIYSKVINFTK